MTSVLLAIRALTLVITTVYGFLFVYVLTRAVPIQLYTVIVLSSGIANYVLASDVGYSAFVYSRIRQLYFENSTAAIRDFLSEAVTGYALVAAIASAIGALVIAAALPGSALTKSSVALYFVSIVISFPWTLLRRAGSAVDLYVEFEFIEMVRRTALLIMLAPVLLGMPFLYYSIFSVSLWVIAFSAAPILMARRRIEVQAAPIRSILRHLNLNRAHILPSGGFALIEFAIFNYPYLFAPLLFVSRMPLVQFDIFFKIIRFGTSSFAVSNDTFIIYQTRAYYQNNKRALWLYVGLALALAAVPFLLASGFILFYGDVFFRTLLSKLGGVSPPVRFAMVGMLAALLLQNCAGALLVGLGRYRALLNVAVIAGLMSAALVAAVAVLHLPFEQMMFGYVAVYGIYAVLVARQARRQIMQPAP
jgi:hypothetical protein